MKSLLTVLIVLLPTLNFAQAKSSDILGVWLTQIEDGKIEVYQSGDKFYGKIVWIAEPLDEDGKPLLDKENPNEDFKKRPVMGVMILKGFTYEDGEYVDGTIYDPKNGENYKCKMWLENGSLKVRGYVGWLYDTKTWSRVKW